MESEWKVISIMYLGEIVSETLIAQRTGYYNYNYLSVPLKAGYSFGDRFSRFFNVGIAPSFLIKATEIVPKFNIVTEYNNETGEFRTYNNEHSTVKRNITDIVSDFDINGLAEVGLNYNFRKKYILFSSLLYQKGFKTITNSNYYPTRNRYPRWV